MVVMSLKLFRNFIVLSYEKNVIDDLDFTSLYDYSQSGEIYPYQKDNYFNL